LKLLPILVVAAGGLVAVLFTLGFLDRVGRLRIPQLLRPSRQPALRELSNEGRYAEVLNWSAEILADKPLDSEALLFRGIAHFYLALAEADRLDPVPRLDQAIIALRRARLDSELRYRDEAAYLLGKAYYHKGPYYYDLAIRFLTESLEHGYEGSDTHEYLGMALVRSGAPESGVEHFHAALQRRPSGLLYLSVGQLLERLGRYQEAERHFQAAAGAGDETLEIRARFMLGALLLQGDRYAEAGEQYQRILEVAPGSADAHLFLGDAYAGLGNVVRARAEWRRARNIDQQHHGANLRLRG
jgi:tetratricopeptide (TPR) repeat protein